MCFPPIYNCPTFPLHSHSSNRPLTELPKGQMFRAFFEGSRHTSSTPLEELRYWLHSCCKDKNQ